MRPKFGCSDLGTHGAFHSTVLPDICTSATSVTTGFSSGELARGRKLRLAIFRGDFGLPRVYEWGELCAPYRGVYRATRPRICYGWIHEPRESGSAPQWAICLR